MARLYMMSCHLHNLWANTAVPQAIMHKKRTAHGTGCTMHARARAGIAIGTDTWSDVP